MRLFKYLHPDRIDVLKNGTIRFSSAVSLNDPFELQPHIASLTQETLGRSPLTSNRDFSPTVIHSLAKTQSPELKATLEALMLNMSASFLQNALSKGFEELIGVLCLSETYEDLLMWAHYADSHQGFVIELDTNSSFFDQRKNPEDDLHHLRKVKYEALRPQIPLSQLDGITSFLTKSTDWKYEAEWRMMLPLKSASITFGSGAKAIHLFEFPKSTVKSVYFGCRMPKEKRDDIIKILNSSSEYSRTECLEALIDKSQYKLNFEKFSR